MKVRALRGVCIGVDRHLAPGDPADLEPALVQFLASIGAVERVPDAPAAVPAPEAKAASDDLLAGQPLGADDGASETSQSETTALAKKAGKKEK